MAGESLDVYQSPTTTRGDLIRRGASADERVAVGADNALLSSNGTDPGWETLSDLLDAITGAPYIGRVLVRSGSGWTSVLSTSAAAGSVLAGDGAAALAIMKTLSEVLDAAVGSTRGGIAIRGASGWTTYNPETAGWILTDGGPGADPSWASMSDAIDAAIGSTRGAILYRGASGWAKLDPVASGRVLTDGGAGADPSWVAPASSTEFADDVFRVKGSADATKKIAIEVDGLTASTTRTLTVQDKSGTIALVGSHEVTRSGSGTSKTTSIDANTLLATNDAVLVFGSGTGAGDNFTLSVGGTTVFTEATVSVALTFWALIIRTGTTTARVLVFCGVDSSTVSAIPDFEVTGLDWTAAVDVVAAFSSTGIVNTCAHMQLGAAGGGASGGSTVLEASGGSLTSNWTTNTTTEGDWVVEQVGDYYMMTLSIVQGYTNAPDTGQLTIDLPAGWKLDTTVSAVQHMGSGYLYDDSTATFRGPVWAESSDGLDTLAVFYGSGSSTFAAFTRTAPITIASGDDFRMTVYCFVVPE